MVVACALVLFAATVVCPGYGSQLGRCLRFGGGSCCPLLNAIDRDMTEAISTQPTSIVFLPRNKENLCLDNICATLFPLPDDSSTYLLYSSRVYKNGFNEIKSFIMSETELGVRRLGKPQFQITDTVFAQVECDNLVYLIHRCNLFGDCPSGVFGFSKALRPISRSCMSIAQAVVRNNGLPEDDFYILPMRLPSRCVLNQVCTIASTLQAFCQTVGVTIPTVIRCTI